ncbi:MAG: DNRLRE domain-containing protein [Phycisphaerae bacterium]
MKRTTAVAAAIFLSGPLAIGGEQIILNPSKDNTLYEAPPVSGGEQLPFSNARGVSCFFGMTMGAFLRRAVMRFEIAGNIPANAQIDSVSLTLHISRTNAATYPVNLHRLLSDWGEATSMANGQGGTGSDATVGDCTWLYKFYPTEYWTTPGGDFVNTVSGSGNAGAAGSFINIASTPGMVADVQLWLDSPEQNFGWCLRGNELILGTTKRIDSRESGTPLFRPRLLISYSMPALLGDMNCDGVVSVGDIGPFVLALTDPAGYALQFPTCDVLNGDINQDTLVSVGDIGAFVALLTN